MISWKLERQIAETLKNQDIYRKNERNMCRYFEEENHKLDAIAEQLIAMAECKTNKYKKKMSSDSPCKECPVMEVCYSERNRCWADVIKAYGEEGWDYPDPRCEKAPELKNRLDYDS